MISMIENFYHGRTEKVTWRCQVQTYLRKKRNWREKNYALAIFVEQRHENFRRLKA